MNTNNDVQSVYIPNIHNKWSRSAITDFFRRENYGIVKRIDFTEIVLPDGSKKPNFKSAFVFFITNNPQNPLLMHHGYRMYPSLGLPEYWIALPNKSVVPDCNETLQFISNRFGACYNLFNVIPENDDSNKEYDIFVHDTNCLTAYETASPAQFDMILTNKDQICHNSKLLFERLVALAMKYNNLDNREALRGIHPSIDEFI